MKRIVPLLAAGLLLAGCAFLDQFRQMAALAKCEFRVASVDNPALFGIPIAGMRWTDDFGYREAAKFALAVRGNTLPLTFTVMVEAKNPNAEPAGMSRMEWILLLNGDEMLRGALADRVDIPANGTGRFGLATELDLRKVLSGKSLDQMLTVAFAVGKEGSNPVMVTLKVKPTIMVGTQAVEYPDYITVNTKFGGEAPAK